MKIIDGLKLDGWQVEIPDCVRTDLPEFFKEMGFKVGAEIGVFTGLFSEVLCRAGLKVYSIDPWIIYPEFYGPFGNQERQEKYYEKTKKRLAPYDCVIIRKTSMEAVKDFEDGSLDFVYIDGSHDFMHVTEDIWEWSKKVKKGGIISGHDYYNKDTGDVPAHVHVKYVLDSYTKAYKIPKWYIIGKENKSTSDRDRSWFWFNE